MSGRNGLAEKIKSVVSAICIKEMVLTLPILKDGLSSFSVRQCMNLEAITSFMHIQNWRQSGLITLVNSSVRRWKKGSSEGTCASPIFFLNSYIIASLIDAAAQIVNKNFLVADCLAMDLTTPRCLRFRHYIKHLANLIECKNRIAITK